MKRLAPVAGLEPGDRLIHGDLPAPVPGAPVQEAADSLSFYVHVDGALEPVRVYRHVAAWIEPIHPALDPAPPPSGPPPLWETLAFAGYTPAPASPAEVLDVLAGIARQVYGVLSGLVDDGSVDSTALRAADTGLWNAVADLQAAADKANGR